MQQLPLFEIQPTFPSTRYQGSKRTLIEWIGENVLGLSFDSALDVFGGTGAVSYLFKSAGKQVIYNDYLKFNWNIGFALIENPEERLSDDEINRVMQAHGEIAYPDFIQATFRGVYFTDEENAWLDRIVHNIDNLLDNRYKQALARFALFQACIIKRPYNLFHRANLYMRTAEVERSFGNKTTWDTPFETHFRAFAHEANDAVFDNQRENRAINIDALETPVGADLVYLDPPYLNKKGVGVDYRDFYHFLEGLMSYREWGERIDYKSKHRRLMPEKSPWNSADRVLDAFDRLIQRHRDSVLVISYRDDGIPSKTQLIDVLASYKNQVTEASQAKQYALAHGKSHEILLIGR